jgi:hypothetical protein
MIRFLLSFAALLVLLNAGVFLWPDKTNHASHVYAAKADVNPHFVRLNKEIEERFYSRPIAEVRDDIDPEEDRRSVRPIDVLLADNSAEGSQACYRIGPFMHQANYELAQAVLFNAGVDYKKSKRISSASNVFRIYLGPFNTQAEVNDARIDLKRSKVLDHFVRKQSDGTLMISLGIYSTAETANTALRLFNDKLGEVKQRSENVVLPDSYWLHFNDDGSSRMVGQLSAMDWGEPSAKMGLFACRT